MLFKAKQKIQRSRQKTRFSSPDLSNSLDLDCGKTYDSPVPRIPRTEKTDFKYFPDHSFFKDDSSLEYFELRSILAWVERPYRSYAIHWLSAGAGLGTVILLPFGPLGSLFGALVFSIVGLCLGLIADYISRKRKLSLIAQKKKKLIHLMRWAEFHFSIVGDSLPILLKVVSEFKALSIIGAVSYTARRQLTMLYRFLSRNDVQSVLLKYVENFVANWKTMSITDISVHETVFLVCINCCKYLNNPMPQAIKEMFQLRKIFTFVNQILSTSNIIRTKQDKLILDDADWVNYADAGNLQFHQLLQANLTTKPYSSHTYVFSPVSEKEELKDPSCEEAVLEHSSEATTSLMHPLVEESQVNLDIRDNSATELKAFKGQEDSSQIASDLPRLEDTPSSSKIVPKVGRISGVDLYSNEALNEEAVAVSVPQEQTCEVPFFRSFSDMINFDVDIKHQIPIRPYEVQFLLDLSKDDPNDKSWDLIVNRLNFKLYRKKLDNNPCILVRANIKILEIPRDVLVFFILHLPTRSTWDRSLTELRVVKEGVEGNDIIYSYFKAPWPVSDRDFLQWRYVENRREVAKTAPQSMPQCSEDQPVIILMRSASSDECPEKPGVVRAESLISGNFDAPLGCYRHCAGYIVTETPEGCDLVIIAQTNINGYVPPVILNQVAQRAPVQWTQNLTQACRAYMEKSQKLPLDMQSKLPVN